MKAAWQCEIPRAEGQFIAGPWGPLASLPGSACWERGVLWLEEAAFGHLVFLGTLSGDRDGRITREDDHGTTFALHAGGAAYLVTRTGEDGELQPRPGGQPPLPSGPAQGTTAAEGLATAPRAGENGPPSPPWPGMCESRSRSFM